MQELIEVIRVAVSGDASIEQKASGAQACRTILAALDSQPGKPIAMPGTPTTPMMGRLSIDQVLDLAIAKLTTIASSREATAAPTPAHPQGLRVPRTPPMSPRPVPKAPTRKP